MHRPSASRTTHNTFLGRSVGRWATHSQWSVRCDGPDGRRIYGSAFAHELATAAQLPRSSLVPPPFSFARRRPRPRDDDDDVEGGKEQPRLTRTLLKSIPGINRKSVLTTNRRSWRRKVGGSRGVAAAAKQELSMQLFSCHNGPTKSQAQEVIGHFTHSLTYSPLGHWKEMLVDAGRRWYFLCYSVICR